MALFVGVPEHLSKRFATRWWNNRNVFTLTITPPKRTADEEFINDHAIQNILRGFDYWLVAERADGRLHYHGCIRVAPDKEVRVWTLEHIKTILRPVGFCKLVEKPGKRWIEYCFKEYDKQTLDVCYNHHL